MAEVDISQLDFNLIRRLIDYALRERQFVVYVNRVGKFLLDFEDESGHEIALALVEESPHFIVEALGFGITHHKLEFVLDE